MSRKSTGPDRKHLLEVYCKCLRRAERRIIIAGQLANGRRVDLTNFHAQKPLILHAKWCIATRGVEAYGSALMLLQVKRSRLGAELAGLPW